jgi:hypothetical protein
MKSRKYPSYEAAIADLESKGKLEYGGWEGQLDGFYIYSFQLTGGLKYILFIYKNGLVKIAYEVLRRE